MSAMSVVVESGVIGVYCQESDRKSVWQPIVVGCRRAGQADLEVGVSQSPDGRAGGRSIEVEAGLMPLGPALEPEERGPLTVREGVGR